MPNDIKRSGVDGLALQVTEPARSAGLVEENSERDATYLADVRVYNFNNLLLVVDREEVPQKDIAELVAASARDTKTIYQAQNASVHISGNGYQVQLPGAEDAGFRVGDTAPCKPASGLLVIHRHSDDAVRLGRDLVSMRREQVNEQMNHD